MVMNSEQREFYGTNHGLFTKSLPLVCLWSKDGDVYVPNDIINIVSYGTVPPLGKPHQMHAI